MAKPPLVSSRQAIKAFQRLGFILAGQRGSHVKLKHPTRGTILIIPAHIELDRWTLKGILKDAEISVEEFIAYL